MATCKAVLQSDSSSSLVLSKKYAEHQHLKRNGPLMCCINIFKSVIICNVNFILPPHHIVALETIHLGI